MSEANDKLWINLKILSRLPAFSKLNTHHELFYIEKGSFIYPLSIARFIRGDTRELTVRRIDGIISKAQDVLNNKHDTNLIAHLIGAATGLQNMKKTYGEDQTMIASIDRLLDKINAITGLQLFLNDSKLDKKKSKNQK